MSKDPTETIFDEKWGQMPYDPGETYSRGVDFSPVKDELDAKRCKLEQDTKPTNRQEEDLGRKFDNDKPRWDLLPWPEVEEIVEILTFGSKKYEDNNWMFVKGAKKRYFGALCRHVIAWWKGEKRDPESGKSHLAHAGCCLLFLMWFDNNDQGSL